MRTTRLIVGVIIVVIGALTLVQAMGYIQLDWAWLDNWENYIIPVLLLIIGARVVASSRNLPYTRNLVERDLQPADDGKRLQARLLFSGSQFHMSGKPFPGADIDVFMAGATLDLRGAQIEDGCVLNVRTMLGGLELWVDPNIRLEVRSNCIMGGVGNHVASTPNAEAKTIILNANCFMGGVDIKG